MREARAAGKTYMQIAVEFDVSITTVIRHLDDKNAEKYRKYVKKSYDKVKNDPERYAKLRERVRNSARLYRQRLKEERNEKADA
ncbi:hypothetical protein EVB41_057 [Rhizobium phage RHph_TM3_14A]|nr:hypothetical protein EVB29_057 [Rhizobium phage RHph_TM27A]QIG66977.1 hypothetical protein EVB30_057 [Rhizobium phage RHph_TM27B]QIG67066.1 hypothetical protein EVB31_056 [Rhizobium phage RHph_TM29]QIG67522.1 hypothetical protein EVB41_057 [Rhizobium phage RHph_TM3_14A]